jgi:GTP diphosphokinase / guanosine-3',5'-bis(diphosphate) 3'-diphosphatase
LEQNDLSRLLAAVSFAASKHRDQRRKDRDATPYINHPIALAETLARMGITDIVVLQAAILHDTIEDTETTPEELEANFGPEVRKIVAEVTDDKRLPKETRKQLQIEHSASLSERARLVKIADKICNVRDVAYSPSPEWDVERRRQYLDWSEAVVAGCSGTHAELEAEFRAIMEEAREVLHDGSFLARGTVL